MHTYEITWECANGDWHFYQIEAQDFHAAVENAMRSYNTFDPEHPLHKARLIRVEQLDN